MLRVYRGYVAITWATERVKRKDRESPMDRGTRPPSSERKIIRADIWSGNEIRQDWKSNVQKDTKNLTRALQSH